MNGAEASSHQPKKRGPKAKFTSEERRARKRACDNDRYYRTQDKLKEIGEVKPQLKVLGDRVEEMQKQLTILNEENAELVGHKEKVNSELLPAIAQDMNIMKDDVEVVKNHSKKMRDFMENFTDKLLQKELTDDDLKNMDVPWDKDFLEGVENKLAVSALFEHTPNGIDDLPTNKLITQGAGSSQTGMSEQHLEKIMNSNEELKSENEKLNSKVNALNSKVDALKSQVNALTQDIETLRKNDKVGGMSKQEILAEFEKIREYCEELKKENKEPNSRVTAIETDKGKDAKK